MYTESLHVVLQRQSIVRIVVDHLEYLMEYLMELIM